MCFEPLIVLGDGGEIHRYCHRLLWDITFPGLCCHGGFEQRLVCQINSGVLRFIFEFFDRSSASRAAETVEGPVQLDGAPGVPVLGRVEGGGLLQKLVVSPHGVLYLLSGVPGEVFDL